MGTDKEADKKRRIKNAHNILTAAAEAGADAARFCDLLFVRGAAEDVICYEPVELAALARDAFAHVMAHRSGSHSIRIADTTVSGDPRRETATVIEIANDNMPFLVDSVMGELRDLGCKVRLVVHPILMVERNRRGRITRLLGLSTGKPPEKATRLSLIHIHVDPVETPQEIEKIRGAIDSLLVMVRKIVGDWPKMVSRVRRAIDEFQQTPPPIPVDEIAEAVQFLQWLADDNFTFLGARDYAFTGGARRGALKATDSPGLGLLSDPDVHVLRRGNEMATITPEVREFLMQPQPLIITKANVKSRVHRRVHMDYVGVKKYDGRGRLTGELRLVGLFTSTAYTRSVRYIPYLRRKVDGVIRRAALEPQSHSGKALLNVLENYPRDELFQIEEDRLFEFANAIHHLDERPRVRALLRYDRFERFVSVLVFVPRNRYSSVVRGKIADYLTETFDGRLSAWYVNYPEGPLARVHYIIGRYGGKTPNRDPDELERTIARIIRTWADTLNEYLAEKYDPTRARLLGERYATAFSEAYKEAYDPRVAIADIDIAESGMSAEDVAIDFYARGDFQAHQIALKVYHRDRPIPLSERVPVLENMGFRVVNERTYRIEPADDRTALYLHDMTLERADNGEIAIPAIGDKLEAGFKAIWSGKAENDGYNALVLNAGMEWRDIAILRAFSRYLRQARIPFSQDYMWATLNRYWNISAGIIALFRMRFDPVIAEEARRSAEKRIGEEIDRGLEAVESLDEDRILRRFLNLVNAVVRTNIFQTEEGDVAKATFAFKLDPQKIDGLPAPRPYREIFVYGPRVEGVHLRFGPIARGGLRWSDRPQDFRTEVLGLVKAQQVKNAVIVPVGAKGGFVPKRLPVEGGRDAIQAEGVESYKTFVSSLLDVTDNLGLEGIEPPAEVVRRDGDDPYLVVAADKGTATFSDIANAISESRGFWLGDAFASGGSAGYDHKRMGITARGAWEAVKRHFRELDRDIQSQPFSVVGVGDMSGDVFGNGMLLSRQTRLIAAFDHRDIFLDPDPDPETSHGERERLFRLARSSWQDYDRKKISKGGGVFSRSAKRITISAEARAALGIDAERLTPPELISAILRAPADLLWFGGIGTYVRALHESDDDVGDRANDAVRVVARDLRVKVVGEGANLGMTQNARIEFALHGGRCNSDAIDNSAGVNTSDVEVNIKIALGAAMRAGRLTLKARNRLLVEMTDQVAALVLRNNYLQTLALSLAERRSREETGIYKRFMDDFESRGLLDRVVENLPEDADLENRAKGGQYLTRPEIAVLLAYAKIVLFDEILESSVPDDAYLGRELYRYFPELMHEGFSEYIETHQLRREIIATMLANSMVNRGGPTLVYRLAEETGARVEDIAFAFAATRDSFGLTELNSKIDALDNRLPGALQLELYAAVQDHLVDRIVWFLRIAPREGGLAAVVRHFRAGITELAPVVDRYLPPYLAERVEETEKRYVAAGVPRGLARRVSRLPVFALIPDMVAVADHSGVALATVAEAFFAIAEYFKIGRLEDRARTLDVKDYYDRLALDRARQTLGEAHRRITVAVLAVATQDGDPMGGWIAERRGDAERTARATRDIAEKGGLTVSRLAVAAGLLADLARETVPG